MVCRYCKKVQRGVYWVYPRYTTKEMERVAITENRLIALHNTNTAFNQHPQAFEAKCGPLQHSPNLFRTLGIEYLRIITDFIGNPNELRAIVIAEHTLSKAVWDTRMSPAHWQGLTLHW